MILTVITTFVARGIAKAFGIEFIDAVEIARKWIPVLLAFLLIVSVFFFVRGCYVNYRVNKTQEVINELRKKDAQAEAEARVKANDVNASKIEADKTDKRVENAEKAVEEIQKETGVSVDEATKNLCLAYPGAEICK